MKVRTFDSGMRLLCVAFAALMSVTFMRAADAQEGKIDKVQQGVAGVAAVVSAEEQERYGLLTLSSGCSASLLRNNWAITAAHCIDTPVEGKPGEFITAPDDSVTLTANWNTVQERRSMRIISFRPSDVAIIRVATPFTVNGSTGAYNREIYRGALVPVNLLAFGRGIFQFAQGSGATAMPSQQDGQYRSANFITNSQTNTGGDQLVWFPSITGPMIAGGDSGGPSFTTVNSAQVLFGVHARSRSTCLPGRPPGQSCANSNWTWIDSTLSSADAPVALVWDEIDRYLGAFVPPRESGVHLGGKVKVQEGGTNPPRPICELAREARARNSPAAPGLEGQCVALINALAARGEAVANQDPLAVTLRNQYPEGPARRGFDIGMAAAEGQTAPGPGKQSILESLLSSEKRGYTAAVTFSLERNRYAAQAAIGAAIAATDTIVAGARNAESDVFYKLGFDIATAIFGDPKRGAQGNTATGPGSLGARNSLGAAGQRGFDAAVKLHLSRNYKP